MRTFIVFLLFLSTLLTAGETRLDPVWSLGMGPAWSGALVGDTAFVPASPRAIQIYDLADPQNPTPRHWLALPENPTDGNDINFKVRLAAAGDRLAVAAGAAGLVLYHLDTPAAPRLEVQLRFDAPVVNVALQGQAVAVLTTAELILMDLDQACPLWRLPVQNVDADAPLALSPTLLTYAGSLYDLSNPAAPQLLALTDVFHVGDALLARDAGTAVQLIDLTDPEEPLTIAQIDTAFDRFQIHGDLALGVAGEETTVFDLSQPQSPSPMITLDTGLPYSVALQDHTLLLALGHAGLAAVDLDRPETMGRLDLVGQAKGLDVQNAFVYLAHGFGGLRIFDLNNPQQPRRRGTLTGIGEVNDVDVLGDLAFMATSSGLVIADVFDRDNPFVISRLSIDAPVAPATQRGGQAILQAYPLVFMTGPNHVYLFEASVPNDPQLLNQFGATSWRPTRAMYVEDNILTVGRQPVITDENGGLSYAPPSGFQSYDFSDPVFTNARDTQLQGASANFTLAGDTRYSVDNGSGGHVFQVTDLSLDFPTLRHETVLPGSTPGLTPNRGAVQVDQAAVYVAAGRAGLRIYDAADPLEPVYHTTLPFAGQADDLIFFDRDVDNPTLLLATDLTAGSLHLFRTVDKNRQTLIPWMVQNAGFQGRLTLYNDAATAVEAQLVAVDRTGEVRTATLSLPAQGVVDRTAAELFGDLNGYNIAVNAQSPVYAAYVIANVEAVSGGDAPSQTTGIANADLASTLIFGYVPGDQTAAVVLSAPDARAGQVTAVTLTLHHQGGADAQAVVELTENRPYAALLRDLFDLSDIPNDISLTAQAAQDRLLAGATFVFNDLRQPSMAAAQPIKATVLNNIGGAGIPMGQGRFATVNDTLISPERGGLGVVDLADPTKPVHIGGVEGAGLLEVHALTQTTVIASSERHITTYDITNPDRPRLLDRLFFSGRPLIAVDHSFVYLFDDSGIISVDATRPEQLRLVTKTPYHQKRAPTYVAADFNRLYLAHDSGAVDTYGISVRGYPSHASTVTLTPGAHQLAAKAYTLVLPGPVIIDYENHRQPRIRYNEQSDATWITQYDNFIYQGSGDVQAIDITIPTRPQFGPKIPLNDDPMDTNITALATDKLLILSGNALRIFERNGLELNLLHDSNQPTGHSFTLTPNFIYTAHGVFNIADPKHPFLLSDDRQAPPAPTVLAEATLLGSDGLIDVFAADDNGETVRVNQFQSTPNLTLTQSLVVDDVIFAVGSHLAAFDQEAALTQGEVEPLYLANLNGSNPFQLISYHDQTLYLADDHGGLYLLDVSDPRAPCPRGQMTFTQPITAMAFQDHLAAVAVKDQGAFVLELDPNGNPTLAQRPLATRTIDHLAIQDGLIWADGDQSLRALQASTMSYVIPWVVDNIGFSSRIALYNHNTNAMTVQLRAVDRNGATTQTQVTVPGSGVFAEAAGQLFPGLSGYALHLEADRPGLYPAFLTLNLEEVSGGASPSLTTAPDRASLTHQLLFGSVPGDQIAALVLVAVEAGDHPVQLSLHTEAGPAATTQITLSGDAPQALLAADLFGNLPKGAAVRAVALDGATIAGTAFIFNQLRQPSMARATPLKSPNAAD